MRLTGFLPILHLCGRQRISKRRQNTCVFMASQKIYYSSYTDEEITSFSKLLAPGSWCVFDNTASGAAIENALTMLGMR